jgi:hypothetical protein
VAAARHRGRHRLAHVWACYHYGVAIEIVARPEVMKGFQVLPWAVGRRMNPVRCQNSAVLVELVFWMTRSVR